MEDTYDLQSNSLAGYLYKKSTGGDWQKRYFEINGTYLTYYKTSKMAKLLAALSIPQVGVIKLLEQTEHGFEFQIDIKDRQYILRAATKAEAQTWVNTLVRIRDIGNGPSNPMSPYSYPNGQNRSSFSSVASTAVPEPTARLQKASSSSLCCCLNR
jgi:hypothetical protein